VEVLKAGIEPSGSVAGIRNRQSATVEEIGEDEE
jgi:hypothetical protein